jgi:DNA-binding IclR family transcriptional regulator
MKRQLLDVEPAEQPGSGVQVLARAAAVLRSAHGHPEGLSLAEISRAVGLPRSTVHRLAVALGREGLLEPAGPSGRLRLGPEITRLAQGGRPDLREELRPYMATLASALSETVDLAVLEGQRMRFIDQIPAVHRLRAVSAVGAAFPLHCTANGKAVLALIGPERARALLPARLPRHTPATVTRRAELLAELEQVAASGVAFDREEHSEGISAAGVAFYDRTGRPAALSVPIPTQRFEGRERALSRELLGAGALIRAALAAAPSA